MRRSEKELENGVQSDEVFIACLMGMRARSALRAISRLRSHGTDDQIGVIARSLAEALIDWIYLTTPTVRRPRAGGNGRLLRTIDKELLFLTSGPAAEKRITGVIRSVPPGELERAHQVREHFGIRVESPYWHGAGTSQLIKELSEVERTKFEQKALEGTYYFWKLFSQMTHTNPNLSFYLNLKPNSPTVLLTPRSEASALAQGAFFLCAQMLKRWGDALSLDVAEPLARIIGDLVPPSLAVKISKHGRLGEGGEDPEADD